MKLKTNLYDVFDKIFILNNLYCYLDINCLIQLLKTTKFIYQHKHLIYRLIIHDIFIIIKSNSFQSDYRFSKYIYKYNINLIKKQIINNKVLKKNKNLMRQIKY